MSRVRYAENTGRGGSAEGSASRGSRVGEVRPTSANLGNSLCSVLKSNTNLPSTHVPNLPSTIYPNDRLHLSDITKSRHHPMFIRIPPHSPSEEDSGI